MVKHPVDLWENRIGIAEALLGIASSLPHQLVMSFIKIIVPSGISDPSAKCRELMQNAATEAIKMVIFFDFPKSIRIKVEFFISSMERLK